MTTFLSNDFVVPLKLIQPTFCPRPLTAKYAEKDFDAAVESQERLRRFSHHLWLCPGFALAENRNDLQKHEAEFNARVAFAFTIIVPDESKILGCLYIYPNQTEYAMCVIWLRDSALHLSTVILPDVRAWVAGAWQFSTVRFVEEIGVIDY